MSTGIIGEDDPDEFRGGADALMECGMGGDGYGPVIPPQYADMSFGEFTKEMHESIQEIVQESLGLFKKDPREYYPFYLRIYKYVTIGQQLGYVSNEENTVATAIWGGFVKSAKAKYEASLQKPVVYCGRRSPYATYLLTGKVIKGEKVVPPLGDERGKQQDFNKLEATGKIRRKEWLEKNSARNDIKDDVREILKFFQVCLSVTSPGHPGDTLVMNEIWSQFLTGAIPPSIRESSASPKSAISLQNTGNTLPPIKVEWEEEDDEGPLDNDLFIKVEDLPITPNNSCPASPCSPGDSPLHSPDPSHPPSPSASPLPSPTAVDKTESPSASAAGDRKKIIRFSSTARKLQRRKVEIAASAKKSFGSLQKKKNKLSSLTPSNTARIRDSDLQRKLQRLNLEKRLLRSLKTKSNSSSALSPQKKGKESVGRPSCTSRAGHARQLKLRKAVKDRLKGARRAGSPGKLDRPKTGNTRKTKFRQKRVEMKDKDECDFCEETFRRGRGMHYHVEQEHPEEFEQWSYMKRQRDRLERFEGKYRNLLLKCPVCKAQKPSKILSDHIKTDHGILEDGDLWRCAACPRLKFEERHAWFIHMRLHHDAVEMLEVRKVAEKLNVRNPDKSGAEVTLSTDRLKSGEREQLSAGKRRCDQCGGKLFRNVSTLWQHRVSEHGCDPERTAEALGIPGTDLRRCDYCPKWFLKWARERGVCDHVGQEHPEKIKEWLLKYGYKGVEGKRKTPPAPDKGALKEEEHSSLIDPEGREKCDECPQLFDPAYLPIHKEANHNATAPRVKCPACPEMLKDGVNQWNHYCSAHLKHGNLRELDPVPPELRSHDYVFPAMRNSNSNNVSGAAGRFCDQCGQDFSSPDALKRHIFSVHGEGQRRENYHQCPHCPKQYKTADVLNDHVRRLHLELGIGKCPHCTRDLQAPGKLWKHMMDVHGVAASEAAKHCKVSITECPACNQVLLADRQFANHAKAEHPEQADHLIKTHRVKVRRSRYLRVNKLNDEAAARNYFVGAGEYSYSDAKVRDDGECPECGKVLTGSLGRHRMMVHGVDYEGTFKCPAEGCESRIKSKAGLTKHMRQFHTQPMEEKIVARRIIEVVEVGSVRTVYRCTLCPEADGYMFYYDQIKTHVVAWHPETFEAKPGSAAVVAQPLMEYKCPHCSEIFSGDEELVRKHVEEMHSQWCGRCPECDKVVLDSADLEKHFREEHCPKEEVVGGNMRHASPEKEDDTRNFLEMRECYVQGPRPLVLKRGGKTIKYRRPKSVDQILRQKQLFRKYSELKSKCEICGEETLFKGLYRHFRSAHGITEDGDSYECKFCGEDKRQAYPPKNRKLWVYHMHMHHEEEVNMEELVEEASKVRTKVPWSQMKLKTDRRRKANRSERAKPASCDDDERSRAKASSQESEDDSAARNGRKRGAIKKSNPASRIRRAVPRKNYKKLAGEEERSEEEDDCGKEKGKTSRGRDAQRTCRSQNLRTSPRKSYREVSSEEEDGHPGKGANDRKRKMPRNSNIVPAEPLRLTRRRGAQTGSNGTHNNPRTTVLNDVEREKRLVIRLERLNKKLLERYLPM